VFGTPGDGQVLDRGAAFRGGITEGDLLYVAQGNTFLEMNNAFAVTDRNAASRFTTNNGRVSMASSGSVIVMVDGTNGYNYTIATTPSRRSPRRCSRTRRRSPGRTATSSPRSIETGTNKKRCQISADGTTWNALDYRAVETTPGALIRTLSFTARCTSSADRASNSGPTPATRPFPFQPIRGATLARRLAARWSLAEGAQALYFLGRGRQGRGQAYELVGHQARSITTPDMSNDLQRLRHEGRRHRAT
jgi:hypothetical protein